MMVKPHSKTDEMIGEYIKGQPGDNFDRIISREGSLAAAWYLSDLSGGLFGWYPFDEGGDILLAGSWFGAFAELLSQRCRILTIVEPDPYRAAMTGLRLSKSRYGEGIDVINRPVADYCRDCGRRFAYAIFAVDEAVDVIPDMDSWRRVTEALKGVLSPGGRLLLVAPNRFGVKYLCGVPDPCTGLPFDGMTESNSGLYRFDRRELLNLAESLGFSCVKLYYPLPDHRSTQMIYTDEMPPGEEALERLNIYSTHKGGRVMDEWVLTGRLAGNRVMQWFSNSFFLEAGMEPGSGVAYSAISAERARDKSFATNIYGNGTVEKIPLYPDGRAGIRRLLENTGRLRERGIPVLEIDEQKGRAVMKQMKLPTLSAYLKDAAQNDEEEFAACLDRLWDYIRRSSEHVHGEQNFMKGLASNEDWGVILKKAYIEMIPVNCFWDKGSFLFFDQEFAVENCPAGYVMFRALRDIYAFAPDTEKKVPLERMKERYGLTPAWEIYAREEEWFQTELRRRNLYTGFYQWVEHLFGATEENRKELAWVAAGRNDMAGYRTGGNGENLVWPEKWMDGNGLETGISGPAGSEEKGKNPDGQNPGKRDKEDPARQDGNDLARQLPGGLLQWYDFSESARALFVMGGEDCFQVLAEVMEAWGVKVDTVPFETLDRRKPGKGECPEDHGRGPDGKYDYVVAVGTVERSKDPARFLKNLYSLLNPKGTLLVGSYNRLGLRYFCGERDPFTNRNFDGIEDYRQLGERDWKGVKGRAYAKAELTMFLEKAGFFFHRFYSVLPELERSRALYSEDYLPAGDPARECVPQYGSPDTIFLKEEFLYDTLIRNGLFHAMANGYLIECPLDGRFADVRQAVVSGERGKERAMAAILTEGGKLKEKAAYPEGRKALREMMDNARDLREHGVSAQVPEWGEGDGSSLTLTIKGQWGLTYFRRLLEEDEGRFIKELDRFFEMIRHSSEAVPYEEVDWERFDPDWERGRQDDPGRDRWRKIAFGCARGREDLGPVLKVGHLDLTPSNCLCRDGEFVFLWQENRVRRFPLHGLYLAVLDQLYEGETEGKARIPKERLLRKYHLKAHERLWRLFRVRFEERSRGEAALYGYYQKRRRDRGIVNANRRRMNYSQYEYERAFEDIFRGIQGRKLYLFGSGIFAKMFMEQFGTDYEIAGILDNNREKWGTKLAGIEILPPDTVKSLPPDSCKVIICIKNCIPAMEQMRELGVLNYSVYDCRQEYPRKLPQQAAGGWGSGTGAAADSRPGMKKYHVGYIAGVFDLFHVGHLNLFKRAKEQCDYLIVGVVSDESVMENKKTMPWMPFEDRIELVRSCRYVDEAVELPTYNGDTDEAYRRYHFDVQFSGSDYANDPVWLAKKAYLEKRGAEMVFFPYTWSTSSTKLKEAIGSGLLEK